MQSNKIIYIKKTVFMKKTCIYISECKTFCFVSYNASQQVVR